MKQSGLRWCATLLMLSGWASNVLRIINIICKNLVILSVNVTIDIMKFLGKSCNHGFWSCAFFLSLGLYI